MSSQVAEQESPGPSGNYLFQAPIRVNPSSTDPVTQQIQSKLGDFQRVRRFLDQKDSSGLIGVDGAPPPSPGGPPSSMLQSAAASSSTLVAAGRHPPPVGQSTQVVPNRLQPSPDSHSSASVGGGEFKKPHHQPHHHHAHHPTHHPPPQSSHLYHAPPPPLHHSQQQQQRGGYVKPADGKPPYGGRGGYPGQPVKHGSAGTASHRANGVVPAKGPPLAGGGGLSGIGGGGLPEVSSGRAITERHTRSVYEQVDSVSEEGRVSGDSPEVSLEVDRPPETVTTERVTSREKKRRKRKVDRDTVEKDECSMFGERVADKLRKLPTDRARRMVQHIVNATLAEAETGMYNYSDDFDDASTSGQSR